MIECCDVNIYYKKRNKRLGKKLKFVFLSLLIFSLFLCYCRFFIINQLNRSIRNSSYSYCTESVNQSIISSLEVQNIYEEIINIEKNSNGEITFISTNSIKVNKLNKTIAVTTKDILSKKLEKGVLVPLGSFFGLSIFSGYGKDVYYKFCNVSSVESDFISTFKSVGINQTLHSIYIEVTSIVNVNYPLYQEKVVNKNKILLTECIIIGKVPEVYLNGNLLD